MKGTLPLVTDLINTHLKQTKNGTVFEVRYNNLNELMERSVAGPVRVQGTADGVLPIGVKVDGTAANTATVDQDTAAWRGDSRPIAPGQTGEKTISVVATDSAQPPKKTESGGHRGQVLQLAILSGSCPVRALWGVGSHRVMGHSHGGWEPG